MPPDLSERLERLHEQKLELPPYKLECKDGVYYAVFVNDLYMYWEELMPEVFADFDYVECEHGCCIKFILGRMQ